MRSNLRSILPEGFLPAPYPMVRSISGIEVPEPHEVPAGAEFPPLLVRLAVGIKPTASGLPNTVPYDQYCPSVAKSLKSKLLIDD